MKKKINIEGMSCKHCQMRVENALRAIDGVKKVKVDLTEKVALVFLEKNVEDQILLNSVKEVGYNPISIENV